MLSGVIRMLEFKLINITNGYFENVKVLYSLDLMRDLN